MSSWNGCFRLTDPAWKEVDEINRNKIIKCIQNSRSFAVVDREIHRVFDELIVY